MTSSVAKAAAYASQPAHARSSNWQKKLTEKVTITPSWRTQKPASAALAAASPAPMASSRFTRKPCNQNLLSNKSKNLT